MASTSYSSPESMYLKGSGVLLAASPSAPLLTAEKTAAELERYPLWKQAVYAAVVRSPESIHAISLMATLARCSFGLGYIAAGLSNLLMNFYQLPFLLEVAQIRAAYVHQSHLGVSLARSLFLVCACATLDLEHHRPLHRSNCGTHAYSWVGNMLLAKKLYDAVTDPVIGLLSDQTDTRFGRRKPWIVLGIIPEVIVWVLMWTSPGWVDSDVEKIIYFLAMMLLFSTLSTCTTVPFQALVPDIAPTYHDRTSVVMFNVLWSLLAAMVGTFAWSYLVTAFPVRPDDPSEAGMTYDYRKGYILAAGVTGCVMFFSLMIGITPVKERQSPAKVLAAAQSALQRIVAPLVLFLRTLFELLTFPPFCIVVALNICAAVSQNFFMNSFVLYMKYQLEFEQYTSRSLLILQVRYNSQLNPQSNPIQSNPIQSNPIQSNPITNLSDISPVLMT